MDISPGTEDFIKAFDELVDFIVLSVSKMPRLENMLFQGSISYKFSLNVKTKSSLLFFVFNCLKKNVQ